MTPSRLPIAPSFRFTLYQKHGRHVNDIILLGRGRVSTYLETRLPAASIKWGPKGLETRLPAASVKWGLKGLETRLPAASIKWGPKGLETRLPAASIKWGLNGLETRLPAALPKGVRRSATDIRRFGSSKNLVGTPATVIDHGTHRRPQSRDAEGVSEHSVVTISTPMSHILGDAASSRVSNPPRGLSPSA